MKKIVMFSLSILFLLTSCSKDNQTAKQLEGAWNITSLKINNTETITANSKAEVTFTDVDKNKGRYNTKVFLFNILADEVNGNFEVEDKGSKVTFDEDGSTAPGTGSIVEITNSFVHITYTDDNDDTVIYRAEKK